MTKRLPLILGSLLGLLALLTGAFLYRASEEQGGTGRLATAVEFGAPFSLVDYNGNEITEAAFEGKPSLLFFGFTYCPDVCPTTVYEMEGWFETMGDEAEDVQAFFVTVDPERDKVEDLALYLKPQSDRVVGITGEPQAVWDMAKSWRVYWQKRPLGEGEYTLDHFASIYVLDRDGNLFDKISYGEEAQSAIAKIRAALAS